MKKGFRYALLATAILLLASCSATKYVPEGSYLLDISKHLKRDTKNVAFGSLYFIGELKQHRIETPDIRG